MNVIYAVNQFTWGHPRQEKWMMDLVVVTCLTCVILKLHAHKVDKQVAKLLRPEPLIGQ